MARPLRLQFEGAIYHVCARGNRRERIFAAEKDYSRFENLLVRSISRYQVELHSYVLLPNHFHFLIQTRKPNISRWMQWLITSYSIWFNRRCGLSGHVFQGRYKAFLVEEGKYLLELSRYLHLNPVRGQILGAGSPRTRRERLRTYRWSSYRGYAGLCSQREFVTEELVLGEFCGRAATQQDKIQYRRFVEEGVVREIENPFLQVQWQTVLGTESFVRRLQDRLRAKYNNGQERPCLRHSLPKTEPMELIRRVADYYQIESKELLDKPTHGSRPRNIAMWLLRQQSGLTLREIGRLFGGIPYGAVSERIRRLEKEMTNCKQLRHSCETLKM